MSKDLIAVDKYNHWKDGFLKMKPMQNNLSIRRY